MRQKVSECIPNCRAGTLFPPHLSYRSGDGSRFLSIFAQSFAVLPTYFAIYIVPHIFCCCPTSPPPPYTSLLSRISANVLVRRCLRHWSCLPTPLSRSDDTPSGWQLFPVDIFPVCRRPYNPFRHLRRLTYNLLPSHLSCTTVSIPVVLNTLYHARPPLSLPPTLSAIPTPPVCTTLLANICSTLLFSLSALIFSLHFYFLFWHGYFLSLRCSCSDPICHVFYHLPSVRSSTIWSFPSALYTPICFFHLWSTQLWLLRSCSDILALIC